MQAAGESAKNRGGRGQIGENQLILRAEIWMEHRQQLIRDEELSKKLVRHDGTISRLSKY